MGPETEEEGAWFLPASGAPPPHARNGQDPSLPNSRNRDGRDSCPHRHGPGNARSSLTALGSLPWLPEARKGDKRRTLLSLRSSHPALPNYLTEQPGHIGGILRLLQKPEAAAALARRIASPTDRSDRHQKSAVLVSSEKYRTQRRVHAIRPPALLTKRTHNPCTAGQTVRQVALASLAATRALL